MHAPIELQNRGGLTGVLQRELALTDTRIRTMARITGCTAFVVAIAMVFQIPLPAYVAYLVFLLSHEDAASTLVSSVGGLVAVTLAVASSLLFYVFDAAEPALRIPLLAVSTLAGTFLARTSRLGPIIFLAGFILVLSQTLLDDVPTTEYVTHTVLWLWVVVAVPVGASVMAALLAGESPVALARKQAAQLMDAVAGYIENPYSADPSRLRDQLLALGQLKNKAYLWNKQLKAFAREDNRLIAILLEALQIARCHPSSVSLASRRSLAISLRQSKRLFLQRRGVMADAAADESEPMPATLNPTETALRNTLDELFDEASGKAPPPADKAPPQHPPAAVQSQNRAHARFAFKVMCAVLASYATYTLLDWPGIRTAVTTCFFVSLTTLGESVHKLTLRITGAIIGGLIAGLCIVFVLPSLTDIGELCLLIAVVSAFCAWIATSSETIAYGGMQIAFAFFLGVLQGYSPADDLTVLRDRIVGIVVGNLWITIFFTTLWPVSAVSQARDKWSSAIKQLGDLLVTHDEEAAAAMKADICQRASEASRLNARTLFEWRFFLDGDLADRPVPEARHVEQLASAAFVVQRLKDKTASLPSDEKADQAIAERLAALAKGTSSNVSDEHLGQAPTTLLNQARQHLNEEIDHASRAI
ncbi:FUSC family protein [Dyella nitratireducens]|uniref:Multidrug transporter subunit MdtO n=1 Tax=Dyella nitratireducens TaxID=1849580 RepID=A0ABQ1GEL7_9GAMM|nr:FUSC family protein [Dyella nitratireducens]GGA42201.1 multidrug transporter subunit MdtO [Dyella nitratireducens]GLQ42037.1 multidrug transporter subunit MdtO [Dyella nitratireducens]